MWIVLCEDTGLVGSAIVAVVAEMRAAFGTILLDEVRAGGSFVESFLE